MTEGGASADSDPAGIPVLLPLARAWAVAAAITFAIAALAAYEVSLDDPAGVIVTVLPVALGGSMVVAFAAPVRGWTRRTQVRATAVAVGIWCVLLFIDTAWSILTFGLFALCFALGKRMGVAVAGGATVVWAAALIVDGDGGWALTGPFAGFAVGAVVSLTLWNIAEQNATQASLIAELEAAQHDLAIAERERGVLEERARFAGEIHDTLAQGFTSIVLLSRAAQRNEEWRDGLSAIEATAQENLQAARRLVAAIGPVELEDGSLTDALQRQIDSTLEGDTAGDLRVTGTPCALGGAVEVTLLRTVQEALLNVRNHAQADEVHVTLSYVGDAVVVDVQDDGVGFVDGAVSDRGSLTGGQGLRALGHRVASLGGELNIESRETGGTVVSVLLPVRTS
ncbi:MAG: ATP-binding protein [Actinomycetota bacterium]